MKIQVISQRGRLIGVYIPPVNPPANANAPTAFVRAGPGQRVWEVEGEFTQAMARTRKDVDALHAQLRKKLKLRK